MVAELQQLRCPCCGAGLEVRPSRQEPAQPRPMTANQSSLIEDFCAESKSPFPPGYQQFTSEQASAWIDQNVPPEYIAWRRRRLYGVAGGARA